MVAWELDGLVDDIYVDGKCKTLHRNILPILAYYTWV